MPEVPAKILLFRMEELAIEKLPNPNILNLQNPPNPHALTAPTPPIPKIPEAKTTNLLILPPNPKILPMLNPNNLKIHQHLLHRHHHLPHLKQKQFPV